MKTISSIIFLLIHCSILNAQVIGYLQVNKDSVAMGESLELIFRIENINDHDIDEISFDDFKKLESITDNNNIDTSEYYAEVEWLENTLSLFEEDKISSNKYFRQHIKNKIFVDTFKLRIWDQGIYSLPLPALSLNNNSIDINYTQSPVVKVGFSRNLVNPDTTNIIMPIKGIMKEKKNLKDYIWLLVILIITAILAFAAYLISKRSGKIIEEMPEPVSLPAHYIALKKLDRIKDKQDWKKNNIKTYQSELTYTLREYLENRYQISALENTTLDIERDMKSLKINDDLIKNLAEILRIADMVKFAKATPDEDIHEIFLRKAYDFINITRQEMSSEEENSIIKAYEEYQKALARYKSKEA